MNVRTRRFLAVALLMPAIAEARPAAPAETPPAATVVVDLAAAPASRPWLADAFEQSIARELSGFERLTPVAKDDYPVQPCGGDTSCRLRVYQRGHVDVVLFGEVTDDTIRYELYQTWTPARLATGTIAIGRGQSAIGLKHETRNAFHPVLKHGGLLDQRPYMYARLASSAEWSAFEPRLVLGALAVMALPFGLLAARSRSVRRVAQLRSARWSALVIVALAVAAGIDAALGLGPLGELVAAWPWGFAGLGGLAWGAVVIAAVRGTFPPLDGLTRVAHHDVRRIVATWCLAATHRLAVLAALYAPLFVLAVAISDRLTIPGPWRYILIVPATWLVARLAFASWVECLAAVLDDRLVDGVASPANLWSREIADYLMGYVRRTGWDVDRELLARVLFLPGRPGGHVDGVVAYGGGATHARIVVDKALLELVMGELVEVKPEDKPALWPDWITATVVPAPGGRARRATSAAGYRGRKPRAASHVVVRKPLGQAATLLGYVVASPGERVPLISDNPQDLAVVRELLSEHYPWNAPDPDDEFDATDPTDKDLLFGALVRELGVIQRQDCQLATIKLALGRRVARVMARYPARIADAYPALNFARDHFLQYLHYRWAGVTDLMTARARADGLADMSNQILQHVREAPRSRGARQLRRRLIWLSWFFAEPITDPWETRARRLLAVGVAVAVIAAAGVVVKHAVDYAPIYADRIEAQRRAISEQNQQRKQKEVTRDGQAQEP